MRRLFVWFVIFGTILFVSSKIKDAYQDASRNRPHFVEKSTCRDECEATEWGTLTMRKNVIGTLYSKDKDAQICLEKPVKYKCGGKDCYTCDDPYYIRENINLGNRMPRTFYYRSKEEVRIYY